jgi:hypothetical protein
MVDSFKIHHKINKKEKVLNSLSSMVERIKE